MLEVTIYDEDFVILFTIDFKNSYANISVTPKDMIKLMKKQFLKYQSVIPDTHFIMELMELVLNCAIMKFQEEFFMQILGIVMGTNLAPILSNIYGNVRRRIKYQMQKEKHTMALNI